MVNFFIMNRDFIEPPFTKPIVIFLCPEAKLFEGGILLANKIRQN